MRHTRLEIVFNNLVLATVCPYCHKIINVGDQLAFYYWCPKCRQYFGTYKTPFTAHERRR
jgi:hypothetical protein